MVNSGLIFVAACYKVQRTIYPTALRIPNKNQAITLDKRVDRNSLSDSRMRNELQDIITNFRHDQELALAYLHGRLGIPVPSSKYEWAQNGRNQIESSMPTVVSDGVQLRKHGVGIEVIHPKFRIDFDYGPAGECDCFDGWRLGLHKHISNAFPGPVECDREIRQWLDEAADSGDLLPVSDTNSFFVWPESRSDWSASNPIGG